MSLTKICSSLNFCGVAIAIDCIDVDAAVDCVDVDAATALAVAVVVAVDCVVLNVVIAV